jgi:hypothetical protein
MNKARLGPEVTPDNAWIRGVCPVVERDGHVVAWPLVHRAEDALSTSSYGRSNGSARSVPRARLKPLTS